jgi:hypothetical protein
MFNRSSKKSYSLEPTYDPKAGTNSTPKIAYEDGPGYVTLYQ